MSNYFPDGRPIQKLMIALTSNPVCIGIADEITGNAIDEVYANFTPERYPPFGTKEEFLEALTKVNLIHINGGTYNFGGNTSIEAPLAVDGGIYISGTESISRLNVNSCTLVLFIKPTP